MLFLERTKVHKVRRLKEYRIVRLKSVAILTSGTNGHPNGVPQRLLPDLRKVPGNARQPTCQRGLQVRESRRLGDVGVHAGG